MGPSYSTYDSKINVIIYRMGLPPPDAVKINTLTLNVKDLSTSINS